jgi:two-component system, OmpR family, KDP operon response regulator KdpE
MKPNPKLLLLDDDPAIGRMLAVLLETWRYKVSWARNAQTGLARAREDRPDIIVLELDLPDMEGFALLQALREWNAAPVLILSARTGVADKVRALDAGANDFMTKPFAGEELLARLRVLQRCEPVMTDAPTLIAGPLRVDIATHAVAVNGKAVTLTPTEDAIFYILARHAGQRVTCAHLIRAVWGTDTAAKIDDLRAYIWRLRQKLGRKGASDLIRADGGIGYSLAAF